jgi:hypothetical protein
VSTGRHYGQPCVPWSGPFQSERGERCPLLDCELVAPRLGVGDPHAELHGHRPLLSVDHDLFAVSAWYGSPTFPFRPLREGLQAPLERLLRLPRPLGRLGGCGGGRRRSTGLDAQPDQSFLLFGVRSLGFVAVVVRDS